MKKCSCFLVLSLLLSLLGSVSVMAETPDMQNTTSSPTLNIHFSSAVGNISTIHVSTPAYKNVIINSSYGNISIENYLYFSGILLDCTVNLSGSSSSSKKAEVYCTDASFYTTYTFSGSSVHIYEFIPLPSHSTTDVYINITNAF